MTDIHAGKSTRLPSIDQLRGYAIFGMLLVNSAELFGIKAEQLSHHREQFTYADTIAPLFMFVVGMGMRLSWLRRSAQPGPTEARKSLAKRFAIMTLIAFVIYQGWLWDALMDIGLAGLLAVLLIDQPPRIRAAAAFGMVALYQALFTFTLYGPWITQTIELNRETTPLWIRLIPLHGELFAAALNGGPLGPLSWCMILLFGTLAYDLMATRESAAFIGHALAWGAGLCAAGYALSLEWPGVKAMWPISAYSMTAPFPFWASGLCFFHLVYFHLLCDRFHLKIPTLTAVGMNPLFLYILQTLGLEVLGGFEDAFPKDLGIPGFILFYALFAALAYWMYKRNIHIKL